MIKLIPSVFLLVFCLTATSLQAQQHSIHKHQDASEDLRISDSVENEHQLDLEALHLNHDHDEDKSCDHTHSYLVISLDEIISSDDIIDFNCTGGFCMKKSHIHKKGLSSQRQLFEYFMRISA